MEWQIRMHIAVARFFYRKVPVIGVPIGMILDRLILLVYGLDLMSRSINVRVLSISHPSGVLLGGNGIVSRGRLVLMSGVKFGGRSLGDAGYLQKHKQVRVFDLGDNVDIGSNSVVLGPVSICDNLLIGSMSLVNNSITEPGVMSVFR